MEYKNEYFEDSVIDGFYVPSMIKKAWAAQKTVLEEIDKVCRRHGIRWWADCGTLLGTIRHGGYIPWDDDLDICMLRDDVMKFRRYADELPAGYDVKCIETHEDYDNSVITRVINKTTVYIDEAYLEKYHGFPYVAGIDIFALDYVAPNPADEDERLRKARLISSVIASINPDNENQPETRELVADIEKKFDIKFSSEMSIKWQLRVLLQNIYTLYTGNPESEYVVLMSYWRDCGNHKYPLRCFEDTAYMPFDNMMMPVPACYNEVLTIEYGNYMRINRSGGVHDYPFYTGMKKQLFSLLDYKSPFDYEWKSDYSENIIKPRYMSPWKKLEFLISENNRLTDKCDDDLLMYLQQLAIDAGTAIEENIGENKITHILEDYCEIVYRYYGSTVKDASEITEETNRLLNIIKQEVLKIKSHREIVFLSWKSSFWQSMDEIYRKASSESGCDVYVIRIPYYYRKADGTPYGLHYDEDSLPEYVSLTDINDYNLEIRHPAVVYTDYPYDDKNDYITSEERFYSENIRKCTDRLIYVCPFRTDEIEDSNERAIYNMRYYATMPAVVNADVVLVQSGKMRERYIDVLTKWAGEDTRRMWESRISVVKCDEPSTSGEKNRQGRKKLLFCVTISDFLENREKIISKLESVMRVFSERREEIDFWWYEDRNITEILPGKYEKLWEDYSRIKENYIKNHIGLFDEGGDPDVPVNRCDAYYGSPCILASRMSMAGKPVMIADVQCDS